MTGRDPEGLPERGGTAGALVGLAEGFARDWLTNGVILLSLIVVGAGIMVDELPWLLVGPPVGLAGVVVGLLTIVRRLSLSRSWLALVVAFAVDVVLLTVMFTR